MGRNGGTQMYCPSCQEVRVCKAIPLAPLIGESCGQRLYKTEYTDINWFRRGRECQYCFEEFITSEMNEELLEELVELRRALGQIKENATKYTKEANQASLTLKEMSKSLDLLKALKIYQNA
jgi:hypothetical protein